MLPSRRHTNGRSPLVRKQCQITTFFSPGKSPSHSPNPNPSPCSSSSPSSLLGCANKKKSPLVIAAPSVSNPDTPSSVGKKATYSSEVVGKRIRVFWPFDNAWYEGHIRSFDKASGKHVIQYDDAEEECLDLEKENIEWLETERPRNLRRLRRMTIDSGSLESEDGCCKEASTDDEEWDRRSLKDDSDNASEGMNLKNKEDGEEDTTARSRRSLVSSSSNTSSRTHKRRKIAVEKMDCIRNMNFDDKKYNTDYKTPGDARRNIVMHHTNSPGSKFMASLQ